MLNPKYEPTADSELNRRHDAILKAMAEKDIDAIVMYNFGDMIAGTTKYITGITHYYPFATLFSAEGIALFKHGVNKSFDADIPFLSKGGMRLPVRLWTCPFLPGITYLANGYGAAISFFIRNRGFKKVGWAGYSYLPASICEYLKEHNSDVEFVDFSDALDDIRLVKSDWEIKQFQRCVDLHDKLIMACQSMIRPYLTCHMLNLEIMDAAAKLGAIEFNTTLINHWRDGVTLNNNSQILPGDYIWALIEVAGVGGEWGECARLFRLGEEPEQKYVDISDNLLRVQDAAAAACKPGAIPEDIFNLTNNMMVERGYFPENRICLHGQSYDIVDLPLFTEGDKKPLQENMFLAIHPTYYTIDGDYRAAPCFNYTDNYLVGKNGSRLLSNSPRKIIPISI